MFLLRSEVSWILGLILMASLAIGCGGGDSVLVKEEDYGEQWPLTVPEAELFCKGYYAIYVKVGENHYGVNGTGINYLKDNFPSTRRELQDIWRADPRGINPHVNISPLMDAGEELCDS